LLLSSDWMLNGFVPPAPAVKVCIRARVQVLPVAGGVNLKMTPQLPRPELLQLVLLPPWVAAT
jgi:hypothetical protein